MFGRSHGCVSISSLFAIALILQLQTVVAGNTLSLRKNSENLVTVNCSNAEGIAGIQFSINARGGVKLISFEGTERVNTAAFGVYQYLNDDETLTVVMLAPVRSMMPAGEGMIGKVTFSLDVTAVADTVRLFLANVVICDAMARVLTIATTDLVWSLRDGLSRDFVLEQNYPNPFNPSTKLVYKLEKPEHVRLVVYDVSGRQITMLIDQYQRAGRHTVHWNSDDANGSKVASGMYFARLQVGSGVAIKKMILAK